MALDTNSTARQPHDLSRELKAIVFAGVAAVLVWEVDSRTFVAFLANLAPEQVPHIRWPQSTADARTPLDLLIAVKHSPVPPAALDGLRDPQRVTDSPAVR
jgi:hypothetical protein